MEQEFIDILKKLVQEQGNGALTDAKKCKAFLGDYTGSDYRKECRFIVQAAEAEAAKAIAGARDLASCKKTQVRALEDEYGLSQAVAADIVDALALVLRGDTSRTALPKAAPKAAPQVPAAAPPPKPSLSAEDCLEKGKDFLTVRQFDKAIEAFTMGIELDMTNPEYYGGRGEAYLAKGQFDKAIEDYTVAINLCLEAVVYVSIESEVWYGYYKGRGTAYLKARNKQQAIDDLKEATLYLSGEYDRKEIKALLKQAKAL